MAQLTLYLARHGQTLWNCQGRLQGHKDSPLSLTGYQQALTLGEGLRSLKLDAIISSDLGRCRQTAELCSKSTFAPVFYTPLMRERGFGELEGKFRHESPELWQAYANRHYQDDLAIAGAESASALTGRAVQLVQRLHRYPGERLLLLSHGEWIRSLLNWHQGLAPYSGAVPLPDNAQLIRLTLRRPADGQCQWRTTSTCQACVPY